jgi:hypothetical protein
MHGVADTHALGRTNDGSHRKLAEYISISVRQIHLSQVTSSPVMVYACEMIMPGYGFR